VWLYYWGVLDCVKLKVVWGFAIKAAVRCTYPTVFFLILALRRFETT
jgi:hypothetical protein